MLDTELFRSPSDSSKCKDRAVKGMFHCLSTIDWDYIYVMFKKFCDQSCRNVSKGDSKHYRCIFVNAWVSAWRSRHLIAIFTSVIFTPLCTVRRSGFPCCSEKAHIVRHANECIGVTHALRLLMVTQLKTLTMSYLRRNENNYQSCQTGN